MSLQEEITVSVTIDKTNTLIAENGSFVVLKNIVAVEVCEGNPSNIHHDLPGAGYGLRLFFANGNNLYISTLLHESGKGISDAKELAAQIREIIKRS